MGNVSSSSSLAPVSMASTVIGFISFTFTLATFLRVFWENLQTFFKANTESRTILSTLRIELEEERASLRGLRRNHRSQESEAHSQDVFHGPTLTQRDISSMQASVRRLTRRFEDLERPFLADERELEMRKERRRRQERDSERQRRNRQDDEKGRSRYYDESQEDDVSRVEDLYTTVSFIQRWTWLQSRSEATGLLEAVNRVQTRRIARQVGEMACLLHSYKSTLEDMRHGVAVTEDRMSRVVGLRRID